MKNSHQSIIILALLWGSSIVGKADNPLVTHIFTADPTARVFNDTLYVYPSHDIVEHDGLAGNNGFMMEDYHVFSTTDLMNYTDHGVILDQKDVSWVDNSSYAMWAPDCVTKNGKFYFYYPGNFKIGVAVANHPTGPYVPEQSPIANANGIDPCCFIDDDGVAYLYFGGGETLKVMRLKSDMKTGDMVPQNIAGLPEKYKEGSFVFKRNGIYYFTFPHAPSGSEELSYATSTSPLGPFEYKGIIMDRWTDGCWTNHHSIVDYKGQWYLFYHHHDISKDQTLRSICADKLFFNADGSIQKVWPTRRGIGVRKASENIQVDRFTSAASGITTPVLNGDEAVGFYVSGITNGSWVKYTDVDFEAKTYSTLSARVAGSNSGGTIEVRQGSASGLLLATVNVPSTGGSSLWKTVTTNVLAQANGLQDIVLVFRTTTGTFNVNWIRFNQPNTFVLNFEKDGEGSVTVNGSPKYYTYNAEVALPLPTDGLLSLVAKPSDQTFFDGWKLNGESVASVPFVKAGDVVTAVFKKVSVPIDATKRIEAENFTSQSGVKTETCSEGGLNVGFIENGDYIYFKNVDFGTGISGIVLRAATSTSGGSVKIVLDNISNPAICTATIKNTGGWQTWQSFSASFGAVSGVHDVYVKFEGGSGYLCNLNWMEFLASDLKVDARQMKSGIQLVKNQDLKRVSFMFSDELVPLVVTVNNLAGQQIWRQNVRIGGTYSCVLPGRGTFLYSVQNTYGSMCDKFVF